MTLSLLPSDLRPREKLLANGPAALADVELVALLLRTGIAGQGVLQMAQSLLDKFDGLHKLMHASGDDLKRVKGLGPAKRAELSAVLEIARRLLRREVDDRPFLGSVVEVKKYLRMQIGSLPREVFVVLFYDASHRLLRMEEMFQGTLTQATVHPREVVRRVVELGAASVVLAHNHPSGHCEPSSSDRHLTQRLKAALQLIDVAVVDHLVVCRDDVISFAERGLL